MPSALNCDAVMTGEKLIRKIVLQAKNQTLGTDQGGWVVISLPKVSERYLSLYIKEAHDRGLLKAVNVTNNDSPRDEWKILDITATGLQFLEETRRSRKAWLYFLAAGAAFIAFAAWLIPVLISLFKH
jgi:Hypothetical protein (DUF2513)